MKNIWLCSPSAATSVPPEPNILPSTSSGLVNSDLVGREIMNKKSLLNAQLMMNCDDQRPACINPSMSPSNTHQLVG